MKPQYDVEQLIANIKRRCTVPTSQITYSEEDFALIANDELHDTVVPLMMSTREEYFVDFYDVETTADNIIPFPEDTVGAKLRSVCYVQQGSPLVLVNLPRIDLDIVAGVGFASMNTLAGFYIQGNDLILYPPTSVPVGTVIRIYYYKRTLVLAPPAQYGQVVSIDALNLTVQLDYLPTTWDVDTQLNAISSVPGFGVTSLMTITNTSSPTIVVDTVEGLSVGDYVSELGFAAIPQVPIEAHPYLAQCAAVKCLEGLGDREGMQAAQSKANEMKMNLLVMISQRVDGSVKKVMNPSGGLRLNAGIGRSGRGWSGGTF